MPFLTTRAGGSTRGFGFQGKIPFKATGGSISIDGLYTVHSFGSAGTFTVLSGESECQVLIVGGGGGGGAASPVFTSGYNGGGGGGGAGEVVYIPSKLFTKRSYDILIGQAGSGGMVGQGYSPYVLSTAGGTTDFVDIGSAAGGQPGEIGNGSSGYATGGAGGTSGNGFAGGSHTGNPSTGLGSGGGGATAVGKEGGTTTGFMGGAGYISSISGSSIQYAPGGTAPNSANEAPGGIGSGGFGGYPYSSLSIGGPGAAGIVIVRYLTQ